MINNRELFRAIYDGQCKDRFCLYEQGLWPETYDRWQKEGLPDDLPDSPLKGVEGAILSYDIDIFKSLNILWPCFLPIKYVPIPSQAKIIEEQGDNRIELDAWGTRIMTRTKGVSLPQYLEWPIKNKKDWEKYRELFEGPVEQRLPKNWSEVTNNIVNQSHGITAIHVIGLFAFPREVMGLEPMFMALYDDLELIEMMLDDRLEFYFRTYEKPVREINPDMIFIWEDMSYIHGPLMSPQMCRELLLPRYKKLVGYFNDLGMKRIVVDSDGDVSELLPIWREAGINGIMPFEVKANNNVEKLTAEWPDMVFIGGIDKHEIAKGPQAIDRELEHRLPAILGRGNYVASLDHWIPPDISFNDYCYYRDQILQWHLKS